MWAAAESCTALQRQALILQDVRLFYTLVGQGLCNKPVHPQKAYFTNNELEAIGMENVEKVKIAHTHQT